MAHRKARAAPTPNGSMILWLAGGVVGASAALVLAYHFVLGSHAAPPAALDAAHAAARAEVLAANPEVASAHSAALKEAAD